MKKIVIFLCLALPFIAMAQFTDTSYIDQGNKIKISFKKEIEIKNLTGAYFNGEHINVLLGGDTLTKGDQEDQFISSFSFKDMTLSKTVTKKYYHLENQEIKLVATGETQVIPGEASWILAITFIYLPIFLLAFLGNIMAENLAIKLWRLLALYLGFILIYWSAVVLQGDALAIAFLAIAIGLGFTVFLGNYPGTNNRIVLFMLLIILLAFCFPILTPFNSVTITYATVMSLSTIAPLLINIGFRMRAKRKKA